MMPRASSCVVQDSVLINGTFVYNVDYLRLKGASAATADPSLAVIAGALYGLRQYLLRLGCCYLIKLCDIPIYFAII